MDEFTETSIATLMGRQISIHRHDPFARYGRFATCLTLLGLLFSPLCIITLLMNRELRLSLSDPGFNDNPGYWPVSILWCLALWLLAGVEPTLKAIARRRDRISLYEKGFSFHLRDCAGFCIWNEVKLVKHQAKAVHFLDLFSRTHDTFTITCQGKPDIVLDEEISGILALGRAIQSAVRHWLVESAAREIQAQGEAMFGFLILSLEGVRFEQETLPWSEIESVEVVRWPTKGLSFRSTIEIEDIIIRKVGTIEPWAMIPVSEVPNEFVLVDLAKRFLSPEPGLVRERPIGG